MDMVSGRQTEPEAPLRAEGRRRSWWRGWVALLGFAAIAIFFLVTEHRAHFFGVLPYLLLLLCPVMHLWMHGGHGHSHAGPPAGR